MALIGKIRKHSWIMVVLIGLALLSFLVMDVVTNNSLGGSQTKFSIGKVNGKSIDYNDFSRTEQILYNSSTVDPYVRRNYLWNYLVESSILETQSDKLGFGVSETEMEELQFGNNLSPIIQQRIINPSTGIVDRDVGIAIAAVRANPGDRRNRSRCTGAAVRWTLAAVVGLFDRDRRPRPRLGRPGFRRPHARRRRP